MAHQMTDDIRKRVMGYDSHTPLCRNCAHFKGAQKSGIKGHPIQPQCKLGGFSVRDIGCCDRWCSRTGDTLA